TFKHALTHEVVSGSLLFARRRPCPAPVTRAIEHLYADRLIEHAERLAYHALRGEEWSRAARYSLLAGGRAMAQARYAAGAALYETVIRAIDHQGEGADLSLKLDACLELWVARVESGLAEGFEELGERAGALARALDDRQRLAQVRVRQAQGSWIIWVRPDGLATAIERAREAFDLAVPSDLRTRSYARFRGYVRCTVTSALWQSDYRVVDTALATVSPVQTLASFVVEEGIPAALRGSRARRGCLKPRGHATASGPRRGAGARRGLRLDSRQPSFTEVPMR